NAVAQRLGIPVERVFINLQKYGNTSGAACAIALDEAIRSGKAKKGDIVLMVTFGAGLTWSSAAIRL
ncbi:MAG: 3-oxoacyl-ACP synthase, partial [Akkermansia sp.]|nr:3-oxoacyl-ACP synthase [Akkermansia sp.]